MPETRIISTTITYPDDLPAELKVPANAVKIEEVTAIISNAQLADEAERDALAKAGQLIDAITNLAQAKLFLKRLCARLVKNGLLS